MGVPVGAAEGESMKKIRIVAIVAIMSLLLVGTAQAFTVSLFSDSLGANLISSGNPAVFGTSIAKGFETGAVYLRVDSQYGSQGPATVNLSQQYAWAGQGMTYVSYDLRDANNNSMLPFPGMAAAAGATTGTHSISSVLNTGAIYSLQYMLQTLDLPGYPASLSVSGTFTAMGVDAKTPIPAAALLLASGLAGLSGWRRMRRAS